MKQLQNNVRGIFVLSMLLVLFCTSGMGVQSQSSEFLIHEGEIAYEQERIFREVRSETCGDSELEISFKMIETITVTNISASTIRFTRLKEWTISGHQEVNGVEYAPTSLGFIYGGKGNVILRELTEDTLTDTFVEEMHKETGIITKVEYPLDLWWINLSYDFEYEALRGMCGTTGISTTLVFPEVLTHSRLYCDNSTTVQISDHAMWGVVSEFKNINGRNAIVVTPEEVPEGYQKFVVERYYDVASGLFLGHNVDVLNTEYGEDTVQDVLTMKSQTVLEQQNGGFISGFTPFSALLGLIVLKFMSRKQKK